MIDHRHLRQVLAIAENGSFRKAAGILNISQPALSRSIAKLEQSLGFKLFDRDSRKVSATAMGTVFIERARRLSAELTDFTHQLQMMANLERGEVKLGTGSFFAHGFLKPLITVFRQSHPQIRIVVRLGNWDSMVDLLDRQLIDFFVSERSEISNDPKYVTNPLKAEPIVFVCRPGHPLLGKSSFGIRDLLSYGTISSRWPQRVKIWFAKAVTEEGALAQVVDDLPDVECEDYLVMKDVVAESDLITGGPLSSFKEEFESGHLAQIPVENPRLNTDVAVVRRRDLTLSPAADAFIAIIDETVGRR